MSGVFVTVETPQADAASPTLTLECPGGGDTNNAYQNQAIALIDICWSFSRVARQRLTQYTELRR